MDDRRNDLPTLVAPLLARALLGVALVTGIALVPLCAWTATAEEWSRLSPGAARWQAAIGEADGGIASKDASAEEAAGIVTVAAGREVRLAGHESAGDDADDSTESDACEEADGACSEALERLRTDTLASIDLDIRVGGRPGNDYPCECRIKGETFSPRRFTPTTFTWKAAGYCHKPLYFEQWNLERYGHSYGFIPDVFLSGAHFFVTLPILPYKMGVELPWECVYPLGYYRPGNCAPWTCPAVPISGRGLALEAATITGAVFLLP